MQTAALEPQSSRERWLLVAALLLSVLLHGALAAGAARIPEPRPEESQWIEMTLAVAEVDEPEPEPEPEPEVPDEPAPEVPDEPEVVEFEDLREEEVPPVPEPKPVARVVQGLTANSFAEGSGSGLDVRAGTTTAARASDDTMGLDDATESTIVPYRSVGKPPRLRYKPTLEVPEEVRTGAVEGRVEIVLTVGADGKVSDVTIKKGLSPAADAACVAAWRRSRWKPGTGTTGATAVTVTGLPQSCKYERTLD